MVSDISLKSCGVVFDEDAHKYYLDGKELSGITGILSKHLFQKQYSGIPKHILAKAAARGTKVHNDTFYYDMTGEIQTKEVQWYADLKEREGFEIIDCEYLVTDFDCVASAIDRVMYMDGKVYLGDIKTTSKLHSENLSWQLSLYKYLFNLLNPEIEIAGLYAIWIKDGATLHKVDEVPSEWIRELLRCDKEGLMYSKPDQGGEKLVQVSENEAPVPAELNEKAKQLIASVAEVAEQIKSLKAKEAEYKEKIEEMFTELGINKWTTDSFEISKTAGYEKETFDSKKFKSENPEEYVKYLTKSNVKGSIKTILK